MSLQVWLPLTKDLRQQGLSNATVTNNGATFDSMGKLGGCYTFGSGKYMRATPTSSLMQAKAVSIACWVKITSWNSSYDCLMSWADGTSWANSRVTLARNNTSSNLRFTIADGTNYAGVNCTTTLALNTWYHVVGTYDGSNIKIYINGNLEGTAASTLSIAYAGTFNIGGWSGNNYPINGSLNDIRLYNHCLSEVEIKELSKGLMLHYPLNRQGLGQENLIAGTDFNGSSKKYTVTSGTEGGFTYTPTETILANTEYTVSCQLRGNANMNLYKLCTGGNEAISWVNRSQLSTTEYRPFSITFTYPSSKTLNQIYICTRYGTSSTSTGDWFEIKPNSLKLEKGSIATSWCPNSSDALATTMGLNSTVEYDCSGYCNNGTRTGTFSWISDTPRYNISTAFEKGIISIPNSFVTTADPIFSVSLWFKLKSGITYTAYTDLISFSSSSYSNQPFRLELCGTPVGKAIMWFRGPSGQSGGFAVKSDISTDEWYHTVLVSEGNKQYSYYVNGEKLGTYNGSANSWTPTGNISLGENINGVFYESDVRLYATALSAEDVLELYHTAARIDNIGNTYVYQYIEA